jgi:RNA polymerase sigma-70 factor (ECF subfamily)
LHVVREDPSARTSPNPDTIAEAARTFSAALEGDVVAFERLYHAHYPGLLRFARRFLSTRSDAEDVVQQVFAAIWIGRANIAREQLPAPYLFGAVRNRALTYRNRFRTPQTSTSDHSEPADPNVVHRTADIELRATLDRALMALPERQRSALLLWWVEELSYVETGRALGISHVAARKLVMKALEHLRPLLDQP